MYTDCTRTHAHTQKRFPFFPFTFVEIILNAFKLFTSKSYRFVLLLGLILVVVVAVGGGVFVLRCKTQEHNMTSNLFNVNI